MNNKIDFEFLSDDFDLPKSSDDLFNVAGKLYDTSKLKIALLIFVCYICLNFDFFIENVLMKISKSSFNIEKDKLTFNGVVISGIILSLFYLVIDVLDTNNII